MKAQIIDCCTIFEIGDNVATRLGQMERTGIDRAVIMPVENELAVYNEEGNRRLLAAARQADDRLIPACCATPWRGDEALATMNRAAAGGSRILVLAPAVQGFMMSDDIIAPLLKRAGELNLPVYVHTGPHSMGAPSQTVLAAQRHPAVTFIIGHCGSTDHAWDINAVAEYHTGANIYLETSLVRPWAIPGYLESAGKERMIFGSATPINDLAFEFEQVKIRLSPAEYPGFFGQNLLRIMGEPES